MNKLYESVDDCFSNDKDVIVNLDYNINFISKEKDDKYIISFEIGFNNGESLFIHSKFLSDYSLEVCDMNEVLDDPLFKQAFIFRTGYLNVELSYLQQVYGNNIIDKLIAKNGINHIKIEFDNDYKIKIDVPLMLLFPIEINDPTTDIKLTYSELNDSFNIEWTHSNSL